MTCASHAPCGRTSWPGIGLFVTVTIVPATLTVAGHPQNGSVTFVPDTAAVWYVATNEDVSMVRRTGTVSKSGLTKIFAGSAGPYPRAGGTTILFESPIARPWIPMSKPGTTPPLPVVTAERAGHDDFGLTWGTAINIMVLASKPGDNSRGSAVRSRERHVVDVNRLEVVEDHARARGNGSPVHVHLSWAVERLAPDAVEVPDRVEAIYIRLDMDFAARVVRMQRLDAHGTQPHVGGNRDRGASRVDFERHVPMIRQLIGSDCDAREGLGRDRRQVVHTEAAQDEEGDHRDVPLLDVNRRRGPSRAGPAGLLPQLFSESRGVGMARVDVIEMPEEVLRLHGDVADGTVIRLRQRVTFRFSDGRMERGLLFRNDAYAPRTHAYIAPEASVDRIGLSPSTLSTARSKSAIVTTSRSSRIANIPASVHIAWMSAPVVPSQRAASTP